MDFFAVTIRNPNTREAYYRAVCRFMDWCEVRGLGRLDAVMPIHVAAYVERLPLSRASVRQHLSADQQVLRLAGVGWSPAIPTRRRRSRDPDTSSGSVRRRCSAMRKPGRCWSPFLLDKVGGLRDRALIGAMLYTLGRVGSVIAMDVEDYYGSPTTSACSCCTRRVARSTRCPAHHRLVEYLGEYMDATGLWHTPKAPLFQALDTTRSRLKSTRMNRQIVFQMVRRRARAAGLPHTVNCHSFRATGITNYLSNGGSLEDARAIAACKGRT